MLARYNIHRNTLTIHHKKKLETAKKPSTEFVLANAGYLVRRFTDSLNIKTTILERESIITFDIYSQGKRTRINLNQSWPTINGHHLQGFCLVMS